MVVEMYMYNFKYTNRHSSDHLEKLHMFFVLFCFVLFCLLLFCVFFLFLFFLENDSMN